MKYARSESPLDFLLDRAGVERHQRALWFATAALNGKTLTVSDIDDYGVIERCWLEPLRAHQPGLEVAFVPARRREA